MVSKKYWDKLVLNYVNKLRDVKTPEQCSILGHDFLVLPGVFSPVYSSDTVWFAKIIVPLVKDKKFLEIGSGSGVISCLAALFGAKLVFATDINKEAIKNIDLNAKRHNLSPTIREGDVFTPISRSERFDIIFWNHPFNFADCPNYISDPLMNSVFDRNYDSLYKFFTNGKFHLEKGGRLLLGTSCVARIKLINLFARKNGFKGELIGKLVTPIYKGKQTKMDLRIYSYSLSTD